MRPIERTLRWLRTLRYTAEVVERRLPHSFVTKDLFGCLDIVAIKEGQSGVLGLQVTSAAHLQDRVKKVEAEPRAKLWRDCGNRLWIVGWSLKGAQGKRKVWRPTIVGMGSSIIPP